MDISTIVVGADEHEQSWDALCLAAALSRSFDARLIVAAALEHSSLPVGVAADEAARRARFERIFSAVEMVLRDQPHERYELERGPDQALHDLAEHEGADLIVLGTTHHGALGRIYPGTVGDKLLEGAPCAVAVAPHDFGRHEHAGFGLVGVAYDGGEESAAALRAAEDLARRLDASLRVISVTPLYGETHPGLVEEARESVCQARLEQAMRSVSLEAVESCAERGDPVKILAGHGVELDLLVIGSRSRGRLRRAILGSVSSELIRTAPCPVIVTPRAARHAEEHSGAVTG